MTRWDTRGLTGSFAWSLQMEPTQTRSAHVRKLSFPAKDLGVTCQSPELPLLLDLHYLQSVTLNYQVALARVTQKLAEPFVLIL